MIKRYLTTGAFSFALAYSSFAQVDKKIEEHAKDTNRQKNAAKADVWVSGNKQIIADTTTTINEKKKSNSSYKHKPKKKVSKKRS